MTNSALRLQANAIHVTSERLRNGDGARMVREPFAMHAGCVSLMRLMVAFLSLLMYMCIDYAKLMRKREKFADGKSAPIDLQTLRASTASARGSELAEPPTQSHPHRAPVLAAPPYDHQKQAPEAPQQPGHSGSYHLIPPPSSGPPPAGHGQSHQMMPPPPPPTSHNENGNQVPPPPWLSSNRGYPDQSYMRTSHPASHTRASPH